MTPQQWRRKVLFNRLCQLLQQKFLRGIIRNGKNLGYSFLQLEGGHLPHLVLIEENGAHLFAVCLSFRHSRSSKILKCSQLCVHLKLIFSQLMMIILMRATSTLPLSNVLFVSITLITFYARTLPHDNTLNWKSI